MIPFATVRVLGSVPTNNEVAKGEKRNETRPQAVGAFSQGLESDYAGLNDAMTEAQA